MHCIEKFYIRSLLSKLHGLSIFSDLHNYNRNTEKDPHIDLLRYHQ